MKLIKAILKKKSENKLVTRYGGDSYKYELLTSHSKFNLYSKKKKFFSEGETYFFVIDSGVCVEYFKPDMLNMFKGKTHRKKLIYTSILVCSVVLASGLMFVSFLYSIPFFILSLLVMTFVLRVKSLGKDIEEAIDLVG